MKKITLALSAALMATGIFAQNVNAQTSKTVVPVFSEVITFQMPSNYVTTQQTNSDGFMLEAIPKDQTLKDWKQMITITGQKDLAMIETFRLASIVGMFSKGYQEGCPKSFSGGRIDDFTNIGGLKNITLVLRCGSQKNGSTEYSETTVINFIQGKKDFYTIQYAEIDKPLGAINQSDIDYYAKKNLELFPITFCDYKEGEKPLTACENK